MATALPVPGFKTPEGLGFFETIGYFFSHNVGNFIAVVAIIIGAIALRYLLRLIIDRTVRRIVSGVKKRQSVQDTQALSTSPLSAVRVVQRTRTLGTVLNNIIVVVIVVVAILLIVQIVAPEILTAITLLSAVLGAGLGFGAQNIVKDVLNGLFMVAEDQLGVGDVIDTGFATGVVESVGIRITQLRDVNGTVWFIRNGEIIRVGNMSQGWSRVIIDLAVPYDTDIAAVQEEMLRVSTELSAHTKWRSRIVEKPEVWGIESISGDSVVIRLVIKTRAGSKDDVARELRARLKLALDKMSIRLPSLISVVLTGFDSAESIRGARPPRTAPAPVITTQDAKPVRAPRAPKGTRS